MPITLSDEQVATLRQRLLQADQDHQVAEFASGIWNDPALSNEAKALAKKKYPNVEIPDHDLRNELFGYIKGKEAEAEKAKQEAAVKAETERYQKQRETVQKEYGFTDDLMKRMEAEMQERRVYDYEAMAPYFASKQPKPIEEMGGRGHFWNHHKQDEFKKIVDDPEDWGFQEIVRAVSADAAARTR